MYSLLFSKLRCLLLTLVLLLVASNAVDAQTKKQLEQERAQIEQQIKKLNNELASAKKNTLNSTAQLNALNKKIKERTRLINNINSQMKLLDGQIVSLQDSMMLLQRRIDSLKHEYGNIIRVLYAESYHLDKDVAVMDADAYNKAFLRRKYFQEYSRYRRLQAAAIREREEDLRQIGISLRHQKDEKNVLLVQEQKHKEELAREQDQQRKTVNDSKKREQDLKAQLSKKEKEKRKLQEQIQKLINEEIAKARAAKKKNDSKSTTKKSSTTPAPAPTDKASADFLAHKGSLSWPVYYKKVSREYGRYTHESGGQNMNNGIDLVVASGTTVSAIYDGKVTRVFTCPDGSKGVIVRHGEYMSVYAGLGSVSVKEGNNVSAKQKIGSATSNASGTSDFSFQLWKGTSSQNPRSFLRK